MHEAGGARLAARGRRVLDRLRDSWRIPGLRPSAPDMAPRKRLLDPAHLARVRGGTELTTSTDDPAAERSGPSGTGKTLSATVIANDLSPP
jgi:hypothetical protein